MSTICGLYSYGSLSLYFMYFFSIVSLGVATNALKFVLLYASTSYMPLTSISWLVWFFPDSIGYVNLIFNIYPGSLYPIS